VTQERKRRPTTPREAARRPADIDQRLDPQLFKALGDPTRVLLVSCLAKCGRPCSVGEIAQCCDVDLSVVSRHLALLARAGVLESQREGRIVRYQVRLADLAAQLRALADAIEGCCAPGGCCVTPTPSIQITRKTP
jgi:DNA-binding transcriptional ArsR family regulator